MRKVNEKPPEGSWPKEAKRLRLGKETLKLLTDRDLSQVEGGTGGGWSGTWTKPNPTCIT